MSGMAEAKTNERKARRQQRRTQRRVAKTPSGAAKAVDTEPLSGRAGVASAKAAAEPGADASAPSYTIDELSGLSGVPSRTIRFYQSSGVLPKPEKRGRVAYYSPHHVERLELIGQLQDRGLRMRAIRELVEKLDGGGVVLEEWLGLEDQMSRAWIDDGAQIVSREDLLKRLGPRRAGVIAELVRAKFIEPQGEDYLVNSPAMLTIAATLEQAGVHVDVTAGAMSILRRHLAAAASEVAEHFVTHAGEGFGRQNSVQAITRAFMELREVGPETVRLLFAQEMEQVLRSMLESGEATRREAKRRRGNKG